MPLDHFPGTFTGPSDLVNLVRHRALSEPDNLAFGYLVDGENELIEMSNRELDRQARAIGAWLESLDLAGERALLLYPPGLEFVAAFFGCLYAGVVAVPVYPPRRNRSLARIQAIADDAQAAVALTTDVVLKRVENLIDETPHLKDLTWLATCHAPEGIEERWEMPDIDTDMLAFLQYTSGSTGTPKGVMLSHANLMHNSGLIAHAFEHTRASMAVFWLPSYHDMGLIGGILQPLHMGRPNIFMSPMAFLQKPFRWLSAISRYGATISGGPNFAYDLCVRKITPEQRSQLDLSSWQVAFNGAEPIREDTINRFSEVFASCGFRREAFHPCYGLAEATLIVSGGMAARTPIIRSFDAKALSEGRVVDVDPLDANARSLVGCGRNLPDQKIVIADPETLTQCPPGRVGEIWVCGPSVAQGYLDKTEESDASFRARLKDTGEGPFLRTGDLGFLQDGELFVAGRLKDLIIYNGVNIYPQDVEATVQQCHARLRPEGGAVFTTEVDGRDQFVVVQELERRRKGDLDAVFGAIVRAISSEHELKIDSILLVKAGSIPKTSSGKIQRHACRKGFLDDSLEVVARWDKGDPLPSAASASERSTKRAAGGKNGREKRVTVSPHPAHPSQSNGNGQTKPTAVPRPAPTASKNGAGADGNGKASRMAELVFEEVRAVARERAEGLTLDASISEIGLDSLERMEILANLEERFGGRFPEDVLPDLETCQQVVEAVQTYLGKATPGATGSAGERPVAHFELTAETYQFDRFPEYVRLKESLDLLTTTGMDPYFIVHEGVTNDRTMIDGRELINFSSYNYVGMSGDPVVVEAAQHACERYGTSVSASRLVSGEKDLHGDLERTIASFVGTEDAVVLVGGHATNETVIGHLLGPADLVLHDALSHNSILQGAILSGATRRPFPHNDWAAADELLKRYRSEYRRVLIVIEGVYSMDGDIPELPAFIDVKKRHKALLMIDEAHSMGVLGATGRGIGEHFGVDRADVDIWMGTLSKSFGSCGGYIAGTKALVDYLKYTAPGFVYSVGLSPPNAAAALASFRLLEAQPERVTRLHQRAKLFLSLAKSRNINTGMSKDSPVAPVILGNSMHALRLSKALFTRGINVQPILYPAVEESAARLRFFITSLHSEEQIRQTVDAIAEELARITSDAVVQAGLDE